MKWNGRPLHSWDHCDYTFMRRNRPRLRGISARSIQRASATATCSVQAYILSSLGQHLQLNSDQHRLKIVATVVGYMWLSETGSSQLELWKTYAQMYVLAVALTRLNSHSAHQLAMLASVSLLPLTIAAKDDDSSSSTTKCPIFDGIAASFVAWLISFTAWVAWKAPELIAILDGSSTRPAPADPLAPTAIELKRIKEWDLRNIQLYGAVVSHVAAPIQSSLHVQASGDGTAAVRFLKTRYGSQSTGDRAEATARLQRSHIDRRAKISESDTIKQFNEMSLAAADIVAAGGAKPDDALMISMFENSLPPSYAFIRQMIRYAKHLTFDAYYNDFLTQVKAEERAANTGNAPTAFAATRADSYTQGGKGRPKGKEKDGTFVKNPCFNCGQTDHLRARCRRPKTNCRHCNANHLDELCPRGPGGKLRDSISASARTLLDRQAGVESQAATSGTRAYSTHSDADNSRDRDWLYDHFQAYMSRKRSRSPDNHTTTSMRDSRPQQGASTSMHTSASSSNAPPPPLANMPHHVQQPPLSVHAATSSGTITYRDLDEYFNSLPSSSSHAFMVSDVNEAYAHAVGVRQLHGLAFIDSQASNFVVPSVEYLTEVTSNAPQNTVDTANGSVKPTAVGVIELQLFDDSGDWHTFRVHDVWVLPGCNRVLYSQAVMSKLGVVHRLDEGYVIMPGGSRKSILTPSYGIEVTFPTSHAERADLRLQPGVHTASSLTMSMPRSIARRSRGADTRASVPQQLLWQRLGFPSRNIWSNVQGVMTDHGLPDITHLRYDFPVMEAVARARARVLPFHEAREPDDLPAPGGVIYMDFAGPLTPSYPHEFRYYSGAVDVGSGYARIVPCHSPTKEIAQQCLELLLSDMRMLMGLSHKLRPHVVVSDQGSQYRVTVYVPLFPGFPFSFLVSRYVTGRRRSTPHNRTLQWRGCGGQGSVWRAHC